MTHAPWFPLYVKDWLVATRGLTSEARGIYMDLLCFAWDGRGLPVEPEQMRVTVGCAPTQWKRVWPSIATKWVERDGRMVNPRQEDIRAEMEQRRSQKSDAGKRGAGKRWQSHGSAIDVPLADGMANGWPSQSQSQPQSHNSSLTLAVVGRASPGAFELSPGQLQAAVPGLVGAWNNLCARDDSPFKPVTVRSHPMVTQALAAHPDIDWWAALFDRVAASDFLRRDAKMAPVDLWWVLEHCEPIAAGRYDNRLTGNDAVLERVLRDLA